MGMVLRGNETGRGVANCEARREFRLRGGGSLLGFLVLHSRFKTVSCFVHISSGFLFLVLFSFRGYFISYHFF